MSNVPIPNIADAVFYKANFISEEQERHILAEVYAVPKPKWTCLSNRRLQNWGGVPHPKGMIAEPIPEWLQGFMKMTSEYFPSDRAPNHVLVNEYLPGQGILAHTDGPLFHPVICTISCGSHTILNFHKEQETSVALSLLLERRSLVVVTKELYHNYRHSINEQTEDTLDEKVANRDLTSFSTAEPVLTRDTRVSLTIRHVPATSKFKLKLSR